MRKSSPCKPEIGKKWRFQVRWASFFAEELRNELRWASFFAEELCTALIVRVWCVRSMCGYFSSAGKISHAIPLKVFHIMNEHRCNSAVLYLLRVGALRELHARLC